MTCPGYVSPETPFAIRRRRWQDWEVQLLRTEYAHTPTVALAQTLERPLRNVFAKAADLALKKSAQYFVNEVAGRLDGVQGVSTRFQRGMEPWNKGKAHPARGRSAETHFRHGNEPHNYRRIGSYRVNADGYLDLKVCDEGPRHKRWQPVHRLVWCENHGQIPQGHIVVFKPGRRSVELGEITIDAIECITRGELIARNTIHRYPEPLKDAIRLAARVRRRIDDLAQQH